jgi:hypothetical protein
MVDIPLRLPGPRLGMYIDTAGEAIGGMKTTTASVRFCPPPPSIGLGATNGVAVVGVHFGKFDRKAAVNFLMSAPSGVMRRIGRVQVTHTHDLAGFWEVFDVSGAASAWSLDTSGPNQYVTVCPCPNCALSMFDIHRLDRHPSSPLPRRNLKLRGLGVEAEYTYPKGHLVKNAVLAFLGTLCIFLEKRGLSDLAVLLRSPSLVWMASIPTYGT